MYASFREFYPFYLSEHSDRICRRMHFIGSTLVLIALVWLLVSGRWGFWWLLPLFGYGFAWIGHFFFEKNRPATFKNPFYSLAGDWVMYAAMLRGKITF
ncbi:MAG: DUF962 domain-containing protein [Rudaea sp.]|uniref:DUF962 domain-containing protein n=1 Tax=unclassified Rudaea TaxID=2627037 RepID=UPI0010F58B87|nr:MULTISPECIES: DUF962 domain-containing protein [unclassified Rudaea]MBN8886487.1 DUF962 domain-containing protein [Rudaea sp.]MBR0345615.1 DUF962 domain-containing protein [Rudaea sp.]